MTTNCRHLYISETPPHDATSTVWGKRMSKDPRDETAQAPLHSALARSTWFANLPDDVQQEILPRLKRRRYEAGETIYAQGAASAGLFGILNGAVRTVGTSAEGHQSLISILRSGEWYGFIGALDGKPYPFSVIATEPVEAAHLSQADCRDIFFQSADRMLMLVLPLIEVLRFAYHYLIETSGRSPRRIVAQRLMDLGRCVYLPDSSFVSSITSLNQDDIAAATYLTRPTVNRVLGQLAKEGAIQVGYGRIDILNANTLLHIAAAKEKRSSPKPAPRSAGKPSPHAEISAKRVREILMEGRWFAHMPAKTQDAILDEAVVKTFKPGDVLYQQGQSGDGLFAVLVGQCRTIATADDGNTSLFSLVHPSDWTGFIPLFDHKPHPTTCVADIPSTVLCVSEKTIASLFWRDAALFELFETPTISVLRGMYQFLIETNGRGPLRFVSQRLYDLARVFSLESSSPRSFIESLTQSDLCMTTGLSRPTVNKVLGALEQLNIIKVGYGKIKIIRPDDLLATAQTTDG